MLIKHQGSNLIETRITPGQFDNEFYKKYNDEESKYFKINHYPSEHKPSYYRWYYSDEPLLSPRKYETISRYEKVPTMKELGKSYHATNRIRGIKKSNGDEYYVVTNTTENRLDLISQMFYNSPIYWWVIAQANNIFDAFTEIPRGKKLRIPPLSSIYQQYTN